MTPLEIVYFAFVASVVSAAVAVGLTVGMTSSASSMSRLG